MDANLINLSYQAGISFLIYGLLARWYVLPFLRRLALTDALQILLIPHLLRQVGGTFLAPTVIPRLPSYSLAWATLLGDLICVLAALAAVVALRQRSRLAIPLCWVFAVIGVIQYVTIALWAYLENVADYLGPHFYVTVYYVTLLGVSQVLIIITLWTRNE